MASRGRACEGVGVIDYHRRLLADEIRTSAYRDAILRVVKPGDVVIDLGCGSGILSFFACEAGAAKVFAIDQSHMADVAALLARHLGLDDRITVLHEKSTKVELPVPADVLVTETIGASGFDEGILGSVIDARTRLLRPDAAIVPQRLALSLVPVDLPEEYTKRIAFWSEPRYGLDLSPLRVFAASLRHHFRLDENAYLAAPAEVLSSSFESARIAGHHTFVADRDAVVHGFAAWFEATLVDGITLTTREKRATHWSQGFLPLERELSVHRGDAIELHVETEDGKWWRWRGNVAGTAFDQTTWFAMPPCTVKP